MTECGVLPIASAEARNLLPRMVSGTFYRVDFRTSSAVSHGHSVTTDHWSTRPASAGGRHQSLRSGAYTLGVTLLRATTDVRPGYDGVLGTGYNTELSFRMPVAVYWIRSAGAMMSQKQCLTRIASQCFVYDRMLLIEALVTPRRPRSGRCESYGFTTTATGLTP